MAIITGDKGAIKIGTNNVAEMESWELSADKNMIESTIFANSGWRTPIPGGKSWTASGSGNFDFTDTNGQLALWTAWTDGTAVTLKLYQDTTVAALKYFSGQAYVKSISSKSAADGKGDVSFSFEGSGELQYLTA